MYINEFDENAECAKVGKSAEDLFELYLKKSGKSYRPANLIEQYKHIDFVVHSKKDIKIDVKGPKKLVGMILTQIVTLFGLNLKM